MLLLLLKRRFEGEGTNNRFSIYLSPKSCQGFLSQQSRGPQHSIHYIAWNDFSHDRRYWSAVHASVYPGGIIDARMDTIRYLEISSAQDYDPRSWSAILGNHVQGNWAMCLGERELSCKSLPLIHPTHKNLARLKVCCRFISYDRECTTWGLCIYACQINLKNGTLGCILFHGFLCWMNEMYNSSLHVHAFSFTVTNKT